MRKVLYWVMIAAILAFGGLALVVALMLSGQLFRAHIPVFLFLWFFLPIVAFWLNTQHIRSTFSISSLKVARGFLVGFVVSISFTSFAHNDRIRNSVGQRFVDGYEVRYYEDTDDYGRPFRAADVSTKHWYSKFDLWLFEWAFLGTCAALPYVTWRAASRAVDEALRQGSMHDDAS